jgi:uncharacterized protein (DUF362 family)
MSGAAGLSIPARVLAAVPDIGIAEGSPAAATRAAVELLGGMKRFVKPGQRVLIKPNMSFAVPPERASNTHPDVVAALAAMCKEAGAGRIDIRDNPLSRAESCLERSGIVEACDQVKKDMVRMVTNERLYATTTIPGAVALQENAIMKDALEADVIIAAPVAKSHSGAGVSLSMKGMMGLVYDRWVMHRRDLHTTIVDLASLLKPHLVVIDATRVLSTGGPGGPGKVLNENQVIASTDMVAADAYAVARFEWYGQKYQPRQVRHILEAHERGLGRMDIENLNVKRVSV